MNLSTYPYIFSPKATKTQSTTQQKSNASTQTTTSSTGPEEPTYKNADRLENMNRITLVKQQRQVFNQIASQMQMGAVTVAQAVSVAPPRASKYSNEAKKEIFLDDMDWTADKVYKGCFMRATVITRAMKMASYITIIEDDKGTNEPELIAK